MEQNNSTHINHESETLQNTSLPQKSIFKLVKNFMKCVGTLIQHVENAIFSSNGIVVTNSKTIVSNDGNEINIEEHCIKQESDDTKKHLKNVKKCVLKLCLLCIEKNIFIECDIKFAVIDFYSCLDESTRSLVLEYLTENVAYIIDHIQFIIEMFNEKKGKNEAKNIRKSLIKLYKQILLIPLNSNLDETPPNFKNLNASQWYFEARNNLAEKLILLRTFLIKLRKTLKKNIPDPETITIEDTDASNDCVKRKNNMEDEQPKKRLKLDQHVFQIPKSPDKNNKPVIISDSDSNKSKKKHKKESDTESVGTKRSNNSDSEVITELLFDESNETITQNESSDKHNTPKRNKTDSESSSKENKFSLNNAQEQKTSLNFRSISESSDLNIENLFTSQLSINEESITFPQSNKQKNKKEKKKIKTEKLKTNKKSQPEKKLIQLTLDDLAKNLKSTRKKEPKSPTGDDDIHLDITHGIFSGLNSGDLEAEINEEHDKLLQRLIKENELNSNSKFLYLQQLVNESKEELSEKMKRKFRDLNIQITWDVPELHTIESRISTGPSPDEQKALTALNVIDKKYNKEDDKIIKRNWKEFCLAHGLDQNPTPFLSLQHGQKGFLSPAQRIKFAQFLAKDLPFRALHSVFRRFRVLFKQVKYGRFTVEEDELILSYCSHTDSSRQRFADLATILQRSRYSIERRYRLLTNPLMVKRLKWNLEMETEVVNSLIKLTNSKNVNDLREEKIPKEYFNKIAKAMGIDHNKVKNHYLKNIYPKLFSPIVLHAGDIRKKIVNLLIETGETDWKNINWSEIRTHFPGVTSEFLLGHIFTTVHLYVPKPYVKDLKISMKFLKERMEMNESIGRNPFSNHTIKRYCMTENGLEKID